MKIKYDLSVKEFPDQGCTALPSEHTPNRITSLMLPLKIPDLPPLLLTQIFLVLAVLSYPIKQLSVA